MEKFQYFHPVKKACSIFLLTIYLFSVTQLYELLRLNVLIQHYYETKANDHSVSFFSFLIMHYVTDDGNNKDNDRDRELPFKAHAGVIADGFSVFILKKPQDFILPPFSQCKTDFQVYTDPFITSRFCTLVWQPPDLS